MTRFFRFIPTVFFLLAAGHLSATTMIKKPNFTGFQVGLLGGGSVGKVEIVDPSDGPMTQNGVLAPTGFAAGLHLGYGAIMGGVFLGIDGGVLKDWASDNAIFSGLYANPQLNGGFNTEFKVSKKTPTFYIAPKFGFQIDNALPYIRLGYTHTQYKMRFTVADTDGTAPWDSKTSDKRSGFMASAGIDFLASPCLVAGLNYDIDLFSKRKELKYKYTNGSDGTLNAKYKNHRFLAKIAYKSNW